MLSWLVVPVALMWIWSLVAQPVFTPRNALVSLPAVALLLGWLLGRSSVGWAAVAVLIALRDELTRQYARSVTRSFGYASVIWVQLFKDATSSRQR